MGPLLTRRGPIVLRTACVEKYRDIVVPNEPGASHFRLHERPGVLITTVGYTVDRTKSPDAEVWSI